MGLPDSVFEDDEATGCTDISEVACRDQPRNFFAYLVANVLTKVADELASARLVLPWLLASVGAPAVFVGFLVPIREAGVLLPQLFVAAVVRRMPRRKTVWLLGAGLSALCLGAMALAGAELSGAVAGWSILGLTVVFSMARGLCSVSAKDVLGKTVDKGRRGTLMGWSGGVSGLLFVAAGVYLEWFSPQRGTDTLVLILGCAAVAWLAASVVFAAIREQPGATEGGGNGLRVVIDSLGILITDRAFRQFLVGRMLLLSVALAPPFYVLIARASVAEEMVGLGMLMVAGGLAAALGSPVWGRLSDRSARWVMALAALGAGLQGVLVYIAMEGGVGWANHIVFHAIAYFTLSIFHVGVRLGRKVYLVDMATADNRATYVAVSNTVIGLAMLGGGVIGWLGDLVSVQLVVLVLALLSVLSAVWVLRLPELHTP